MQVESRSVNCNFDVKMNCILPHCLLTFVFALISCLHKQSCQKFIFVSAW